MNYPCDTYTEKCKDCWNARYNGSGCKAFDEWVEEAKDALSKADKYRWHDLRENPDDLPKDEDEAMWYECVHANHIDDGFYPAYQFYEGEWGTWVEKFHSGTLGSLGEEFESIPEDYEPIVAWRYIEPFEEEENE